MTVSPGPVVEHLNVIEDIFPGQIPGFVDPLFYTLFFKRAEERFRHRIIPAEARPVVAAVLAPQDAELRVQGAEAKTRHQRAKYIAYATFRVYI